ncbi:DUF1501 domain-containing protein [Sphaerotilus sp.]|uniref:DUF1501 domain-containing protein n=1 Tax=Sphaerotilus sp. TaxID=2093942 RepID=UPI002ACD5441|nr:DUF1501 domain-containing protein [Sphaerotilus sp.]MDZ7857998.1 DUF1501 domain-containing protein [Sphaerotilus sp.]
MNASRRHFLRQSCGLATTATPLLPGFNTPLAMGLASIGALAAGQAAAADTSGYRALVCLYLAGGNDAHNWVVPTDTASYLDYSRTRGALAWPAVKLQALSSAGQASGRTFGMPLELAPMHKWYEAGKLAVLSNVGSLVRPLTRTEYLAGGSALPPKLYSHNDQTSFWQSLAPEGAASGWGGRMGDLLQSANAHPALTGVSACGNAVFLTGNTVQQFQIGESGPVRIEALDRAQSMGSTQTAALLRKVILSSGANPLQAEYARITQRSLDTTALLTSALSSAGIPALPTGTVTLPSGATLRLDQDGLARQLRMVAQMIAAGSGLGMRRQVFMVSLGGFDTHANQLRDQPMLMARVANSVDWFLSVLQGGGLLDRTTLFTASDFGRTLTSNGQGSDHGWGAHHFIAGGAVKGRKIYGQFPITALGTTTEVDNGRLLPTTSVTQYAATLGRWMGLSRSELGLVLPTLSNFSATDLGFLA